LEARVGIGQFAPLLHPKYPPFHWLLKHNRLNPAIPFLTPLVSVLVSASGSASAEINFAMLAKFLERKIPGVFAKHIPKSESRASQQSEAFV